MDKTASARIAYVNIFARDIVALSGFYARLFGFAEIEAHRSPIYRCLDAGGVELGFNAPEAYGLLGIADRKPRPPAPVTTYVTIEIATRAALEAIVVAACAAGGRVITPPYVTYYNAIQAVLEDPEGNVFRVNHRMGPRLPADKVENPPWQVRNEGG